MISQQFSLERKLWITYLFQSSRNLWHALLLVVVVAANLRLGFQLLHLTSPHLASWRVREHMWQGFNSSILWISYKLPAQNLNGRSWIGMLRIAEYFRQPSDSWSYSRLFPCLATKNSKKCKQGQGCKKGASTLIN